MRWTTLCALLAAGCGLRSSDDEGALAVVVSNDTDELARQVTAATVSLPDGVLSVDGEVEGVGDCLWGWSIEGPRDGATLSAAPLLTPCGAEGAGERIDWIYQVVDGDLGGLVAATDEPGVWSFDLSGSRKAEITASGDEQSRTYDASLELRSLVGTTDGQSPAFDAAAEYVGWFGGAWALAWSVAEDQSISGTIDGPRGRSCIVSGVRDAVEVDCPR